MSIDGVLGIRALGHRMKRYWAMGACRGMAHFSKKT